MYKYLEKGKGLNFSLKKGKGLKKKTLKNGDFLNVFLHFFWPFFLSKYVGLAKNGYDHEIGRKKKM